MPATSQAQAHLMAMALAYQSGHPLSSFDVPKSTKDEIQRLAKTMTKKQLSDYARAPKGAPQRAGMADPDMAMDQAMGQSV